MLQNEDFTCTGSRVTNTFISCTLGLNAIVYLLGKIVICLPFCFNKYADTALSTPPETPHTILRNDIVLTAPFTFISKRNSSMFLCLLVLFHQFTTVWSLQHGGYVNNRHAYLDIFCLKKSIKNEFDINWRSKTGGYSQPIGTLC